MKKIVVCMSAILFFVSCSYNVENKNALVLQTDFGLTGSAIGAMYGVMYSVDPNLDIFDLTHFITPYDIWEGSLVLEETALYWPKDTVFVSVVDPGVGTDRKSVVLKTKTGQYFVTPDNGALTFVADKYGIDEVREIDEAENRRADSEASYTFHGRDVYVYTAAKLASGKIKFEDVGKSLGTNIYMIPYEKPVYENNVFTSSLAGLDFNFGNVWTLIPRSLMLEQGVKTGDILNVKLYKGDKLVFNGDMPLVNTFGDVAEGSNLAYFNSQLNFSFAVNMDSFVEKYNLERYGLNPFWRWTVQISKK